MQPLQSPNSPEKPRLRAACDACRQSKVRCSGGQVCVRCEKHEFHCTYSIASRAGKPKGSRNKATLKKLENLQATKRNASSKEKIVSWTSAPNDVPGQSTLYMRDRRQSDPAFIAMHHEIAWSSHSSMTSKNHGTHRTPSLPDTTAPAFQPISAGFKPYVWEGALSADLGSFGSMETPYMSPVPSQYIQSPGEESTSWSNMPTEPETPVDICGCMRRQTLSQQKLDNLGRDPWQLLFEPAIDVVFSSLSSCQLLFNCTLCSRETSNLLAATALLDRLFSVLTQAVFQAVPSNPQEAGMGHVSHSVSRDYTSTRKSLVTQSIKIGQETLELLKGLLDPSVDLYTFNGNLQLPDLPILANTDATQKNSANHSSSWGMFRQDAGIVGQFSSSIFENGNPRSSVDSEHIAQLHQFVRRYEAMLENLQMAISCNIAPKPPSTVTSFGLQAAWIPNVFESPGVSVSQIHCPQPFQHSGSPHNVVGF